MTKKTKTFRDGLSDTQKAYFDIWIEDILRVTRSGGGTGTIVKKLRELKVNWQKEILVATIKKTRRVSVQRELNALLELPESIFSKATRLNKLEKDIYRIWNKLDTKTKSLFSGLLELALVTTEYMEELGITSTLDDLLWSKMRGWILLAEAQNDFPNDPDIAVITELNQLTAFLTENSYAEEESSAAMRLLQDSWSKQTG